MTSYEREILERLMTKLDAVVAMAGAAGFNRGIRIETADADPLARFTTDVTAVRLLAKLGRAALASTKDASE